MAFLLPYHTFKLFLFIIFLGVTFPLRKSPPQALPHYQFRRNMPERRNITVLVQNSGEYKKYVKNMWLCIMAMNTTRKKTEQNVSIKYTKTADLN